MTEKDIIVTELVSMMTVHSKRGRYEQMHRRKYYGLSFCESGRITYTHNGTEYVSHRGCAILLPEGEGYTIRGNVGGWFPLINFRCTAPICHTPILFPIDNAEPYLAIYEKMRTLHLMGGHELQMMSLFYEMLHSLLTPPVSTLLAPALSYIEKHYDDPHLTNAVLAAQCNISEVYFRKLFTRQYQLSPRQWLLDFRLGKAKQLLREGNLKISAIAEACGFSGQYYFSHVFKERTGMTPTEYIRQSADG